MAPALGYAEDKRVAYSLGNMGHGVSMSHLNGAVLADLILERSTELSRMFFDCSPRSGGFTNRT
ncbi:MAG: hypothetical protein ACOCUB_00475 [Desulfohalobiaceae bacterium]